MTGRSAASLNQRTREAAFCLRPVDRKTLYLWCESQLGINPGAGSWCDGHDAPLDYLYHTFFEMPGDAVVWANRGGGKTMAAAVATCLDILFKPGIEVLLLGGSLEQSERMYAHLRTLFERPKLNAMLHRKMTARQLELTNGSLVRVLAQSQTSIRGHHVQRIRCDEVELFDPEIWAAAQLATQGKTCGKTRVRGSIEALSTMHRPFGLMQQILHPSQEQAGQTHRKIFHWCALDVLQRCGPQFACENCAVRDWCNGAARHFNGFLRIEDFRLMRHRVGRPQFAAEVLCQRPSRSHSVYEQFDPAVHVREMEPMKGEVWIGGMDFGIRSPLVMLWAQLGTAILPSGRRTWRLRILDEYIASDRDLPSHLQAIRQRDHGPLRWVGVDPAGHQRESQTGRSSVQLLQEHGFVVRSHRAGILQGIDQVNRMLDHHRGIEPLLCIHPRCERLIRSLREYHFDPLRTDRAVPMKDGADHAVDALRYMVVNLRGQGDVECRTY